MEKNVLLKNQYPNNQMKYSSAKLFTSRNAAGVTDTFVGHVLFLQSEATLAQKGVGNGNVYFSLPCLFLAVSGEGKAQQGNHICSSLQQQER